MNDSSSAATEAGLLSILIPVYNERSFLRRAVERVLAAPLPDGLRRELILVDDASTDGSPAILRALAAEHPQTVRVFTQPENRGKGAAIRRAVGEMRGEFAIFQDADLEYDPRDYPALLQPLVDGVADVVYGSRFAASPLRQVVNYHHRLINLLLTHLSNWCTGLSLTDMETCYKAFRAEILRTIPIRSDRFGLEPEITAKIARRHCAIYEVPIRYHGRTRAEGKKIGWRDGFSALRVILKYWLTEDWYEDQYEQQLLNAAFGAARFARWTVDRMAPYLGERILEINAGVGNVTRFLPKRGALVVTENRPAYRNLLRQMYRLHDTVEVRDFDIAARGGEAPFGGERFDTVVCLNLLEQLAEDEAALRRLRGLLAPGGRLVCLVAQHPGLYGSYDRVLHRWRRYGRSELAGKMEAAGYRIRRLENFNALGILGWWWNARVRKRRSFGSFQLRCFDWLVPVLRRVERLPFLPGLSLLCVSEPREE